jgi:FkbM family methyltransferase
VKKLIHNIVRILPWSLRGHIKRIPLVAPLQRVIFSRLFGSKEFAHEVDAGPAKGITFQLQMPDDKGIWTGTYEATFAARLANSVRAGRAAYDIGSWHGFFAGVMAAQGASVVHVFEPLPANAARIRKLIELNPTKAIVLHACAVGNRDTEMDLVVMPDTSMAKLEESEFQAKTAATNRVRVRVRTIDNLIASSEAPPPGIMKIDVEGAEMMVLEGARETLNRYRPEIFAEVHSSALLAQCTSLLQAAGYTVEMLDDDEAAARKKDVFQIRAAAVGLSGLA